MSIVFEDLVYRLNEHTTAEGTSFDAVMNDNGVLEIVCSNNDEFSIHMVQTDTQLLTVTPLFHVSEVKPDMIDELNAQLLHLSPAMPLSSAGIQGEQYILFGAMALNTYFENIVHELEVQAENTLELLEAVSPLLN